VQKYHFSILLSVVFLLTVSFSPSFGAEAGTAAFGGAQTITTGSGNLSTPGCAETNDCYTPSDLTATVGEKIIMTNTDSAAVHTFTSGTVDGFASSPDGTFDSEILFFQDSYEWTPSSTGEYPYFCMLHVWMVGSITVVPAPNVPPKPAPTIIVQTDSPTYEIGVTVTVLGSVSEIIPGYQIKIVVSDPMGSIVAIHQFSVGSDKNFSFNLGTIASINSVGTYIITAVYGDVSEDTTSFKILEPVVQEVEEIETVQEVEEIETVQEVEFPGKITFLDVKYPKNIRVGEQVIFDASGSYDDQGEITEYYWYFYPGAEYDDDNYDTREGETIQYTFKSPGNKLFEWDFATDYGKYEVGSVAITVLPPSDETEPDPSSGSTITEHYGDYPGKITSVDISYPSEIQVGEQVTFDASGTSDNKGEITEYHWWFYSDAETDTFNYDMRYGKSVDYTFLSPGTMMVEWEFVTDYEMYEGGSFGVKVLPSSDKPGPDPTSGSDLTIIIIVIVIAAAAAGAGIAISRSRKSSSSETVSKSETSSTESSKTKSSEKGRECNVCGTRIPDGTNVCPNCGDTYS